MTKRNCRSQTPALRLTMKSDLMHVYVANVTCLLLVSAPHVFIHAYNISELTALGQLLDDEGSSSAYITMYGFLMISQAGANSGESCRGGLGSNLESRGGEGAVQRGRMSPSWWTVAGRLKTKKSGPFGLQTIW